VVPALVGTAVPLLVLALGWLRLRRRMTAIVLAFTLGLGTNVLYLAHAVPAAAVTDNTSVFTFRNTSSFGSHDMVQSYTPAAGTALGTITKPSASWNLVDRIDSGTTITLAVYSLVAGSGEPASYTWSWTGSQSASAVMRNYSGVDTSAPVDGHAGATESSAST